MIFTNNFLVDAHSVIDNGIFWDVVCFDMTYKTNAHSRPLQHLFGLITIRKQ